MDSIIRPSQHPDEVVVNQPLPARPGQLVNIERLIGEIHQQVTQVPGGSTLAPPITPLGAALQRIESTLCSYLAVSSRVLVAVETVDLRMRQILDALRPEAPSATMLAPDPRATGGEPIRQPTKPAPESTGDAPGPIIPDQRAAG